MLSILYELKLVMHVHFLEDSMLGKYVRSDQVSFKFSPTHPFFLVCPTCFHMSIHNKEFCLKCHTNIW